VAEPGFDQGRNIFGGVVGEMSNNCFFNYPVLLEIYGIFSKCVFGFFVYIITIKAFILMCFKLM